MKIISCGGISIKADDVLFAVANTGDTTQVYLKSGGSVVVRMCIAKFELEWNKALNEVEDMSDEHLANTIAMLERKMHERGIVEENRGEVFG